ncbi:MAG TPA: OB-fold nucleic acid binding domain-containing protein, partial [Kouleothrix sp.]|nr:OB-fold nucleic acid binding domain-containing protein [Kouleothrix sp.]
MERVWTTQLGAHVGERVRVAGWLHRLRLLSNFSFLILRDGQGLAQIFIDDAALSARLAALRAETVLAIEGTVVAEP